MRLSRVRFTRCHFGENDGLADEFEGGVGDVVVSEGGLIDVEEEAVQFDAGRDREGRRNNAGGRL